jgi:serine/threonine protein kinase
VFTGDLTGLNLGRYQITHRLGHGGMATVYLAHDPRLGRDVAVKVIDARHQETDKFLKRFEREARALAQLSHPNIVKVLDFGEQDGLPYLVMEHIPGGTLARVEKPIPYEQAARLLLPIADALHYAHAQGIIHRDVKPSNILLKASGKPMLSDFGIARMLGLEDTTDLTLSGSPLGSPGYMSPEQGQGKQVDHRTDIYALGTVFYELVTGVKPYKADTPMAVLHKQLTDPIPNPQKAIPTLPKDLARAITTALSITPNRRQADMSIFARELDKFAQGSMPKPVTSLLPDILTPTQTEWPVGKTQGKAWAKWGLGGVSLILVLGLALMGLWAQIPEQQPANVSAPVPTFTQSPTETSLTLAATPTFQPKPTVSATDEPPQALSQQTGKFAFFEALDDSEKCFLIVIEDIVAEKRKEKEVQCLSETIWSPDGQNFLGHKVISQFNVIWYLHSIDQDEYLWQVKRGYGGVDQCLFLDDKLFCRVTKSGNDEVYAFNFSNRQSSVILNMPSGIANFDISPGIGKIAFVSYPGNQPDLFIKEITDRYSYDYIIKTNVTEMGNLSPWWSNSGAIGWISEETLFFFTEDNDIYRVNILEKAPVKIASGGFLGFSPDKKKIAFYAEQVGIFDFTSDAVLHLPDSSVEGEKNIYWSHDGQYVALTSDDWENYFKLYRVDENEYVTISGQFENPKDLAWSFDNKQILFSASHSGLDGVYLVDIHGMNVEKVSSENQAYSPAWVGP